jgi:argininosuccinate lyase
MKGLPLAYNRDMQEDKEPLFAAYDTLTTTLSIVAEMVANLTFKPMSPRRAGGGFLLATDIADYLTLKGLPFREAHHAVGGIVSYCEAQSKQLDQLTLAEYRMFSDLFEEDVLKIDVWSSLRSRDVPGGTSPKRVSSAIRRARAILLDRERA